jgi:hypothetical protein
MEIQQDVMFGDPVITIERSGYFLSPLLKVYDRKSLVINLGETHR